MQKITSRLLVALVALISSCLWAGSVFAQEANTIEMTFSFYLKGQEKVNYRQGDKVSLKIIFPEGKEVKISGVEEEKVVNGGADYTLKANPDGTIMPVVLTGDVTELSYFGWGDNRIDKLTVKSKVLTQLDFGYGEVGSFYCSDLPELTIAQCKYPSELIYADLKNCPKLKTVYFGTSASSPGKLAYLNLSGCPSLETLNCNNQVISELFLDGCTKLVDLSCAGNALSKLNLKGCEHLRNLNIAENQISEIDLEGCKHLQWVKCLKNKIGIEMAAKMAQDLPDLKLPEGATPSNLDFVQPIGASPADLNKMNKADVKKLAAKGWKVRQVDASGYGYSDYEGVAKKYQVTLENPEHGSLSIEDYTDEDLKAVEEDTELTVVAKPEEGYELSKLTANDEDITEARTFIVKDCDVVVKAIFVAKKKFVKVTLEASQNGTISIQGYTPEQLQRVEEGTELMVTVLPAEGYELGKLMANEEDITQSKKFTVEDKDILVKASFVTGVESVEAKAVILYPNPATDKITIKAGSSENVKLLTMEGKALCSGYTDAAGVLTIDLSSVVAGSYLVQVGERVYKVMVK